MNGSGGSAAILFGVTQISGAFSLRLATKRTEHVAG